MEHLGFGNKNHTDKPYRLHSDYRSQAACLPLQRHPKQIENAEVTDHLSNEVICLCEGLSQKRLLAMIAMLSFWYASDSYSTTGSTRGSPTARQGRCRRRISGGGSPPNFATITCRRSPCHVVD